MTMMEDMDDVLETQEEELKSDLDEPAKEKWKLLPEFLKVRGLVKQHIDSFNHFVDVEMRNIVKAKGNNEIRSDNYQNFYLIYEDIYVGAPQVEQDMVAYTVTPQECRLRDITYAAPIYVDVRYTKGRNVFRKKGHQIGRIPVMLRSNKCRLHNKTDEELAKLRECPQDPGGYFVVKGSEKVILIQEQLSRNRIIIEKDSKKQVTASVTSSTHERKSRTAIYIKNNRIYLKHNSFTVDIPVIIALKAMGLESEQQIVSWISPTSDIMKFVTGSIEESTRNGIFDQNHALDYIGKFIRNVRKRPQAIVAATNAGELTRADEAREIMAQFILSHVPVENYDFREKSFFLCYMIRQCCQAHANPKLLDDKDYYGNKRLELAGSLLALLFEDLFKRFNSDLKMQAERVLAKPNQVEAFDIMKHFPQNLITTGFTQAISTGNWNLKRFKMDRSGVTQQLSRLSYMSCIGHMTRITSQFEKTRKVSGPRALQPSQWGMLCPSDTPEGESCGLVKNLALLTHVTSDEDEAPIHAILKQLGCTPPCLLSGEEIYAKNSFVVMLNGLILGVTATPDKLASDLRNLRRAGRLGEFISVFVNTDRKILQIATDGGRLTRPLIIVDKKTGRGKVTQRHLQMLADGTMHFHKLLSDGLIEYIDVNESNNTFISLDEESITSLTTHVEIDPLTILGIVVGLVPFPHHNQSPRNTYQCAMGKQAIGVIGMNQLTRIDTLLYLMVYPQKPMVFSRTLQLVNWDTVPAGQNTIVAMCSFSGYDIEDATILNRGSLDRGFGRCIVLRKYVTTKRTYPNNSSDRIVAPSPEKQQRMAAKYQGVGSDGIIDIGSTVYPGQILVNKERPSNTNDLITQGNTIREYESNPLTFKGTSPVVVEKVLLTSSEYEDFIIKILTRDVRRPEIGDKFASRHGQKGVCGLIVDQADMPFDSNGVCPDLIFNPHGMPSRMTVGLLRELLLSKAGVLGGVRRYGTAFGGDNIVDSAEMLLSNGYSYYGKDVLTCGITGETIPCHIFQGNVFYQKLKHMVLDKIHARSRGPRAILTRQPTEGRSRDGGLRMGEMERDCLVAHGTSSILIERLMHSSDLFNLFLCSGCGQMARPSTCDFCQSNAKLTEIKIPYACKLLFQELQSMNIFPKIILENL